MNDVISFLPGAYEELASCFKRSKGKAYIRIYVQPYTCVGPVARMMRDFNYSPSEKDIVLPYEDFSIVINRSLLEKMEHITFEFNGHIPLIHTKAKNLASGCPHCPYGQEGVCTMTRKRHKNYATWKVAKTATKQPPPGKGRSRT